MPLYDIRVLTDKEFDNLPNSITRGSDVSDSMGFADPYTGRAFVRYTASHNLNKYLINHELEHLVNAPCTDVDENGICHKKVGRFLARVAPIVLGGALGGVLGEAPGAAIGSILGGGVSTIFARRPRKKPGEITQFPESPVQPGQLPSVFGVVPERPRTTVSARPLGQFSVSGRATERLPDFLAGSPIGRLGGGLGGTGFFRNPLTGIGDVATPDFETLQRFRGFFGPARPLQF